MKSTQIRPVTSATILPTLVVQQQVDCFLTKALWGPPFDGGGSLFWNNE